MKREYRAGFKIKSLSERKKIQTKFLEFQKLSYNGFGECKTNLSLILADSLKSKDHSGNFQLKQTGEEDIEMDLLVVGSINSKF